MSTLLQEALKEGNGTIDLDMDLPNMGQGKEVDMSLENLASVLSSHVTKSQEKDVQLKKTIRFPYSRHSSFSELCDLVDAFKPKDVFPCTVDEKRWDPEFGMRYLFGPFCSEEIFRHDEEMMKIYEARMEQETLEMGLHDQSQFETQSSGEVHGTETHRRISKLAGGEAGACSVEEEANPGNYFTAPAEVLMASGSNNQEKSIGGTTTPAWQERDRESLPEQRPEDGQTTPLISVSELPLGLMSTPSITKNCPTTNTAVGSNTRKRKRQSNKQIAYDAALNLNGLSWADLGGLVSARIQRDEEEL